MERENAMRNSEVRSHLPATGKNAVQKPAPQRSSGLSRFSDQAAVSISPALATSQFVILSTAKNLECRLSRAPSLRSG
jgi:hypothetical protein